MLKKNQLYNKKKDRKANKWKDRIKKLKEVTDSKTKKERERVRQIELGMCKGHVKPHNAWWRCDLPIDSDERRMMMMMMMDDGCSNLGPLCSVIRQQGLGNLSECSMLRATYLSLLWLLKSQRMNGSSGVCVMELWQVRILTSKIYEL